MSRNIPVKIADGGNLVTQPAVSLENVSPADFTRLVNWRRSKDQLIRQEGWIKFEPLDGISDQWIFDGVEGLLRLAEVVRPNGDRVIVGASRTKIKAFNPSTGVWDVIGSGFSAQGKRWQFSTINGYGIFNNQVDLPQVFRQEWTSVVPVYEMREVGIASVGRITEYNGFLFLGNIVEIQGDQLDKWMNGYSSYVPGGTQAKAADFAVLLADDQDQFDVTTGAADVTVTLPSGPVAPPTFWIWVKKVDAGVGRVLVPASVNQSVVLEDINNIALIWSDGNAYHAKVFESGVIPATDPYGPPPSDILNHYPYEVAWSEFGEPTRYAPRFSVYMPAASATLELPFESEAFVANETYVAVIGGGANGGTLGGDSSNPNGILVTAVAGKTITLATSTNGAISYPRTVQITRFRDVSTLVGKSLLQGDGSAIVGMLALQNQIIIYRDTGIYVGRFTGAVDKPFAFRPRSEKTSNVPINGDAIIAMNAAVHVYPGKGGRFYAFDGQTEPEIFSLCDNARDLFFVGLDPLAEIFAVDNPVTKQIWFCRPGKTMCLDYENRKVTEMDAQIDAAVFAKRPDDTDDWFVLGIDTDAFTYGLVVGNTPILTWLRDGEVAEPFMVSGCIHFGDQMNEKLITNYTPLLSSPSPNVEMEVQLRSTHNPSAPLTDLLVPVESLPSPQGDNFITLAYQAIYFQDEIRVTDTRDVDARISARFFEVELIKAAGITRSTV